MNWRVVFSIVRKDMVDAVKNYYLLFCIVLPIGMALLFQLVMPNEEEMAHLKVALYAPETSRLALLVQGYAGVEVVAVPAADEVVERVENDKTITGGLVLPPGFDATLSAGEKPVVKAYLSPRASPIQQSVFRGMVTDQAWLLVRQDFPIELLWDSEQTIEGKQHGPQSGLDIDTYLLMVMLLMGLAMIGTFVVPSLMVEEKEKHTLDALLVSPGGPLEVTAGKAIVGMIYSLLVAGILLAMSDGFAGNWPFTVLAVILGALFIVNVGLLMGTAFKVMNQVNAFSSFVMLLLIFPSWMGMFALPEPLAVLVNFVPTYYIAKIATLAIAGNATFANTASYLAILAVCVVAAFAGVTWALRRERK
ncbi:MAG: ABC transporter permease [Chloroflexota bacterium]